MKANEFSDSLTNVKDAYVEESATYKKPATSGNKGLKAWRAVAIAASAVLITSITIGIIAGTGIFDGAGSSAKSSDYYGGAVYDGYYAEEAVPMEAPALTGAAYEKEAGGGSYSNGTGSSLDTLESAKDTSAKIIYTADLRLQSTEFDDSLASIEELVKSCGAYFESKNVSKSSGSYRTANMTIRIPVERYDEFLGQIGGVAKVTSENQYAEDVSDSYYDIQSRLETAKTKLKRLQELLAQAEDMEDIITLESAISETEWTIDDLQGVLNHYDSKVQYSTVSMTLTEVYKITTTEAPVTFGEKIGKAFKEGIEGFGEAMGDLLLWFAESWTWLLFILGINAVIVIIIVACVKGKNRRRAKAAAATNTDEQ